MAINHFENEFFNCTLDAVGSFSGSSTTMNFLLATPIGEGFKMNNKSSFNKFGIKENTPLLSDDLDCQYHCIDAPNPEGFRLSVPVDGVLTTEQQQVVADAIAIKLIELNITVDEIYMDGKRIVVSIKICTHVALGLVIESVRLKVAQTFFALGVK